MARQAPLLIQAARAMGRAHGLCPIGHMLLALARRWRGRTRKQLLASCHPAIFHSRRKRLARGWPLCKVVGTFPVLDRCDLAPRAWRECSLGQAPAAAPQHRAGCATRSGKTFVCRVRIKPRGEAVSGFLEN